MKLQKVFTRILDVPPIWPVATAVWLGILAFALMRLGVVPSAARDASWLVLVSVIAMPIFGGHLWAHESSTCGRAVGAALVLTMLAAALAVLFSPWLPSL
jgi:hypothetical protein